MQQLTRDALEEEDDVDMTPMIDVVFLLIIFFLCIDFRILETKLPAFLPKDVGVRDQKVEPQEKLNIRIVCENRGDEVPRRLLTRQEVEAGMHASYRLVNHEIRWEVGPKSFRDLGALCRELERIHGDPSKLQWDEESGRMAPLPVVLEPGRATTYGDVAVTLDAVTMVGFGNVSFGGGLGPHESKKRG